MNTGASLALALFCLSESREASAGDDFALSANPDTVSLCAGGPPAQISIEVLGIGGLTEDVELSLPGLPFGFITSISPNPIAADDPPAVATLSLGTLNVAPLGPIQITVEGSSLSAGPHQIEISAHVAQTSPTESPKPVAPLDKSEGLTQSPTFNWLPIENASRYRLQVATDPDFAQIVEDQIVELTEASLGSPLDTETTYYWRVRAENGCDQGEWSPTSTLTTALLLCTEIATAIPDGVPGGVSFDLTPAGPRRYREIEVATIVSHTFVGDLVVGLSHPESGTQRLLLDRPGVPASTFGCSGDDIDATFSDQSFVPAENQCAPAPPAIAGLLRPFQTLAPFDGLAGVLRVTGFDAVPGDTGQFDSVCVSAVVESDLIFLDAFENPD